MLKVFKDTKIYILCPSDYLTGGVECLHQLSSKLIKMEYNAKMIYIPPITEDQIHRYRNYQTVKASGIEDYKKNILIIPEIWIDKINEYKYIRKAIWWLSIDNAKKNTTLPIGKINKYFPFIKKKFQKTYDYLKYIYVKFNKAGKIKFSFKENKEVFHLTQSQYAKDFLEKKGVNRIHMLNDYLNIEHIKRRKVKKDIVLYNPKKGKEITLKLVKISPLKKLQKI
jgi:hypothetical protein